MIYQNGKGVKRDYKKAVGWYSKAADENQVEAMTNLAFLYGEGMGVDRNIPVAFTLANIAAIQGVREASRIREIYIDQLTQEQIDEAYRLSSQWCEEKC